LKSYSEPVAVETLHEGNVYFSPNVLDKELLLPTLEPVVFVGKNLEPHDQDRYSFQDAESHRAGVRYSAVVPEEDDATFYTGAAPIHIFEYERALDCLLPCALRRREDATGETGGA
jgi:hypothetical protein